MPEIEKLLALIVTGLGFVAWAMIKGWANRWETRLVTQDDRLSNHDVQIATITANMEHIRVTGDETREDVKQLLRNANGGRSASREQ